MKIPETTTQATSWVFTPVAMAYIHDSIQVMIPWLLCTFAVILADLASGVRKAHLLGIHLSPSTAFRETLGKCVVYFAGILAFAMIDVAAEGNLKIAKWCCLAIIVMEGGSFFSNLAAPYGVRLSPKVFIKFLLKRSPLGIGDEEAEEILKMQERENMKWNTRRYSKDKDGKKTEKNQEPR